MINNIISTTTFNKDYYEFVIPIAQAWKKIFPNANIVIGFILDELETEIKDLSEYGIQSYTILTEPDINEVNYSKIYRSILASEIDGINMVTDIDLLPINKNFFIENLVDMNEESMLFMSRDIDFVFGDSIPKDIGKYVEYNYEGRYPMYYITANSNVWKRIINPGLLPIAHLFQSWHQYGDMENVYNENFSDEVFLKRQIRDNGLNVPKIVINREFQSKMITRGKWKFNEKDLKENKYIDAHLLRPLSKFKDKVKPLFDYLQIPIEHNFEPFQ